METLRKTVHIGTLIYFVYGLVSLFNLKTFIPPFPLMPFIFIVFLVTFIVTQKRAEDKTLWRVFSLWLFTFILADQLLLESFLNYSSLYFYSNQIVPLVYLGNAVILFILILLTLAKLKLPQNYYYILIILFFSIIVANILLTSTVVYAVLGFALFLFLRFRFGSNVQETVERISIVLNGIAIMYVINHVTFFIYS